MKVNQTVRYLSTDWKIIAINGNMVTLRNSKPQLKKDDITVEARYAKPVKD